MNPGTVVGEKKTYSDGGRGRLILVRRGMFTHCCNNIQYIRRGVVLSDAASHRNSVPNVVISSCRFYYLNLT